MRREVVSWLKSLCIAFVAVWLVHQFVFQLSIVHGSSMLPTLETNERLFVNKLAYRFGKPDNGDIVVLRDPRNGSEARYLVKRVVAGPGDTVEINGMQLYVNGEKADSAQTPADGGAFGPLVVPADHYFVLGDHRAHSTDSRDFGVVPGHKIVGRADWIVWPLGKWGGLER